MIEFDINGTTRGFKFGTYTFNLINKLAGTKTTEDVFERLKEGTPEFTASFYMACATHYCMSKKIAIDFEEVDVIDWLDELGFEKTQTITVDLLKIYTTKNLKAPEKGLELQSSNGATSGS
jgi:hypothetical protein